MPITSWNQADPKRLKKIKAVCLDIDDTLSTDGKLTAQAYSALWDLRNAGFVVVPITGRPAGWCDHIARFWPVDAVIGENGAFTFFMHEGVRIRIDTEPESDGSCHQKLKQLADVILAKYPDVQWASDQRYREYDLAIDVCEDVRPWSRKKVMALMDLCKRQGAKVKLSSIHVNAWYGDFDKRKGFIRWLETGMPGVERARIKRVREHENWIFVGDSPNDEPLFEFFKNSVGVANLKKFSSQLKHPPAWITEKNSGQGFCEVVRRLIP